MYNIKEMVNNNKKVRFVRYKNYELWYVTETGFEFPVPIDDCGDATFPAEDKALLYLRYIRKHVEMIQLSMKESGYSPPSYHVTGTDNPIDFPNNKPTCSTFIEQDNTYCGFDAGHPGPCGAIVK